jgi:hypothetical protein
VGAATPEGLADVSFCHAELCARSESTRWKTGVEGGRFPSFVWGGEFATIMCCFGGGRLAISPYRFKMSFVVTSGPFANRWGSLRIDNKSSGT